MRKYFPLLVLIVCILCALWESAIAQSLPTFPAPLNIRDVTTAAELSGAISTAMPGDLIRVQAGTYAGVFNPVKPGTAANPIVIQANGHVVINGGFKMDAAFTYVRDFEITDAPLHQSGFDLYCHDCGAINNVIHGLNSGVGIGAWNTGAGQLVYGNIIYAQNSVDNNPHNIYTQNDFSKSGYKYFVGNYIADPAPTGSTFNFHAYGQQTYVSGIYLKNNIFANGSTLIGSWSALQPDHHQVVDTNYFWNADMRFGYKRPTWFNAFGNYFGKSYLRSVLQWGSPEVLYPSLVGASIFKNNTIAYPVGHSIEFEAYSYADSCSVTLPNGDPDPACPRKDGVNIRPDNDFDLNTYIPGFSSSFFAGGVNNGNVTSLSQWQTLTETAGKKFDANSTIIASEPTRQFYIQNELDLSRGFLVVYNWQNLPSITFSHPGALEVRPVKDSFGASIASGNDSVTVPLSGQFQTFVIKVTAAPVYTLEQAHADLERCLTIAKAQKSATDKYRSLRDCVQIVSDKCEDAK